MDSYLLEKTLESFNNRISRIEAALNIQVAKPEPVIAEPVTSAQAPSRREFIRQPSLPQPSYAAPGNWLGIIAVICFVLAAAFIVKLSIESGWLTPRRQIGLAALLGVTLIAAGLLLRRTDRAYAALLPGAGVVILYLAAFAAHLYYKLISFDSALVVTGFVSGLCVWLYTELKHDAYAFTAVAGAYVAPVALGFGANAEFSLYYFVLCSAAFAAISVFVQSRALTVLAAYLAILLSGMIGLSLHLDRLVAAMLVLHFAIFAAGSCLYTIQNSKTLSASEAMSFLPVLLIFYAMEYYFIDRIYPGLTPWISLGFAALLIGLYLGVKAAFHDSRSSQWLILTLTTIMVFHAGYLELMPEPMRPYLFSVILLAATGLTGSRLSQQRQSVFLAPWLGLGLIVIIEYLGMLGRMFQQSGPPDLAVLAGIASIWALIVLRYGKGYHEVLLGAAHLLVLLAFYRLTVDVNSLAVSASWLLYGAGVLVFAFVRRDPFMAYSSLFVLAFAAGKALLVDAASAATIVRILCLLLTGAVLYGCGLLMRKFRSWSVTEAG